MRRALTILLPSLLAGCVVAPPPAPKMQTQPDPLIQALADAAEQIRQASVVNKNIIAGSVLPDLTPNQLAQITATNNKTPKGLEQRVSLDYQGPFENLIIGVAKAVNWKVKFQGNKTTDQIVSKRYDNETAIEVLRDVGYSIRDVKIIIDTSDITQRAIIIRYPA